MPTSTIWRRSVELTRPRGVSPLRPSDDHIERLSPDPTFETSIYDISHPLRASPDNGYSLRGLGLSEVGELGNNETVVQPNHLYYDHDGSAHVAGRIRGGADRNNDSYGIGSQDYSSRVRGKGHTRSGSTIDDLATAAIATSPAMTNPGPLFVPKPSSYTAARPSTSYASRRYSHNEYSNGPPAKRIKSERIPNLEWSPRAERPRTSGGYSSTATSDMNEDALLLLSLANEVNFKKVGSTPKLDTLPEHQQSISPTSPSAAPGSWNMPTRPSERRQASLDQELEEQHMTAAQFSPEDITMTDAGESIPHPQLPVPERETALAPPMDEKAQLSAQILPPVSEEPIQPVAVPKDPPPKKRRRVEPVTQAEACAKCLRMQVENEDEEGSFSTFWISCNFCKRWFHAQCVGLTKAEARSVDKYSCKDCEPTHGPSTHVRKSSRPRTAIDYAGLNQGLVKSSEETFTHHYIQRIKEGTLTILSDDFARVRPELLTREFMENFDGIKRPFVVPAAWNPRFGVKPDLPTTESQPPSEESTVPTLIDCEGEEAGTDNAPDLLLEEEEVFDCDQDLLDMVIPRNLTVRRVAEMYGLDEPVPVIDVKSQETKGHWTLQKWADYYEQPGDKPIHNVISLEVSHSPMGRLIRRPKVVRDLDLDDDVWDAEAETRTKKRPVSFYCLMSVADSFTDFHIDFGGSSVYYHILKGTKTFFFIPPEDKYLKKYEEWCNSDTQNETWLGDLCAGNCTRVDLHAGDTAFIPAGWIHSVWTPEDSLVIGGNFLTRQDYEMQLKIVNIEKATHVAPKFRYPFFQKVMWYALIKYLEEDPVPDEVLDDFQDDPDYVFLRADPIWYEEADVENPAEPDDPFYNERYYSKSEVNGLPSLRDYLYRTARIDAGLPVPDVTKKQIDAVKASIPKGHGEPLTLVKMFAIWCAWKVGNLPAPEWVHSNGELEAENNKLKKPESFRLPGERTSVRNAAKAQAQAEAEARAQALALSQPEPLAKSETPPAKPKANGLKVACEPCRKRRIKCKHKAGGETPRRTPEIRPRSFSNTDVHPLSGAGAFTNGTNAKAVSPEARTSDGVSAEASQSDPQSSSKKSRSKACEDCRKSKVGLDDALVFEDADLWKRRCVHDQYGRIDPAKVAEPSKPRGSSNAKRARLSDGSRRDENLDDLIDPALTNGDYGQTTNDASEEDFHTPGPFNNEVGVELDEQFDEDAPMTNGIDSEINVIDPALQDAAIKSEHDPSTIVVNSVAVNQNDHLATPSTIRNGSVVNGDFSGGFGWTPGSRQSSRQPKHVERYTPEDKRSPTKMFPKAQATDRRASSAASAQTAVTSIKSERSSSNTSGTTHQLEAILASRRSASGEAPARPISRASSAAESDIDADERLARELQAAENGLRRRTSMRA
ncbi:JmjC domain-containing histone demethylation protein 1 [Cladophialophora chaetospira]|uniref:JmjC domain-containing histone demethylation protein 1 n=1 Tax=Cladophialophora chaetospira TaxID=386627 RepID=A0AA38XI63_9EURO|nr:JmjC domain-containing histone demethylation protein 1 [Cladophialophora chaetospira]